MSHKRPLQELSLLSDKFEGSMLSDSHQRNKQKSRECLGGLDNENTPTELIQEWSPPHKHSRVVIKGKENQGNKGRRFVLARRSRKSTQFTVAVSCWDSLPDELLLHILSCLPLRDLLRMSRVCKRWHRLAFDETLWQSVDLVGITQLDCALGQVLTAGVKRLRCPHTFLGEPHFTNKGRLHVQHMDLSSCTASPSVLLDIMSRCRQLNHLSLEGMELSDGIIQSLAENPNLEELNLCGCSGFSADVLGDMLQSCSQLENLNISWCDFSPDHVKAVVDNLACKMVHLNLSGYRQNLTMEDLKTLVERCPNLQVLDVSDSVLLTTDCFTVLLELKELVNLGLSRCYLIHPASLADLETFPSLRTLQVYGLVQDSYLPSLKKGLPRVSINSEPFSRVARPTPVDLREHRMWNMRCRLKYRL
ncbi:S-phase kinase-associated protein 2 [Osmerus eperlanus]|uniref:S-phase kinase-associated protein 2 n=1 Tax=Osmerus eperlanus TaxID=29151 RepID=UPI002E0D8C44